MVPTIFGHKIASLLYLYSWDPVSFTGCRISDFETVEHRPIGIITIAQRLKLIGPIVRAALASQDKKVHQILVS
jgi:hypothetical protein